MKGLGLGCNCMSGDASNFSTPTPPSLIGFRGPGKIGINLPNTLPRGFKGLRGLGFRGPGKLGVNSAAIINLRHTDDAMVPAGTLTGFGGWFGVSKTALDNPMFLRTTDAIPIYSSPDSDVLRTTKTGEYLGQVNEYALSDVTGNIWYHLNEYGGWIPNNGKFSIVAQLDTSSLPPLTLAEKANIAANVAASASPQSAVVIDTAKTGAAVVQDVAGILSYWKVILAGLVGVGVLIGIGVLSKAKKEFVDPALSGAKKKHRKRSRSKLESSSTRTEVRSPTRTSTSTKADTRGNVTVTGGAGDGDTSVTIGGKKKTHSQSTRTKKRKK